MAGISPGAPSVNAEIITHSGAKFPEFLDAGPRLVAQIRAMNSTNRCHAIAHGDTSEQGGSICYATSSQPQSNVDRVAVTPKLAQAQ